MEYDVIGRERDGAFVLFGLGDGVYAVVTDNGDVEYSIGWAQMTRFVTIDPRGAEAVPADELRSAIMTLKSKYDKDKVDDLKQEVLERQEDVEFNEAAQDRYCEAVARLPLNPDGSIRWRD